MRRIIARPDDLAIDRKHRPHDAEIDRKEHADRDQDDLGRLENAEPENEQRHPGDRGDGAQALQGRIDQAVDQAEVPRERAHDGSARDPERKAPADAPKRGRRMLLQFAGAGEIRESVEDHRRRGHQPPIG
jgi:hypothetical protein